MGIASAFLGGMASGMLDELVIGIRGDTTEFKKSLQGVHNDVKGMNGMLKGIGVMEFAQTAMMAGQVINDFVVRPAADLFGSFITSSSNATESASKFLAVFKTEGPAAEIWAKETADAMGRGLVMVKDLAGGFQAMLDPLTGNTAQAAKMSEAYTKLAIDLSSFYNVSEEEAAASLRSAIAGETEAVRKFGVVMNDASLNAELLAMGTNHSTKEASQAEIQQARFNLIMKATANAQGDAVRTADGYANRMRALAAQLEDIKVMIGDALMPVIKTVMDYVVKGIGWFKDKLDALAPSGKKFMDWVNELVKGGLSTLAKVILPMAEQAFAMLPGILETVMGAVNGVASAFKWLSDAFGPVIDRIRADVLPTLQGIFTGLKAAFADLQSWWNANGKGIFDAIGSAAMGIVKFFEPIAATLRDTVWPIIQQVGGWLMTEFQRWSDWWATDGASILQAVKTLGDVLGGAFSEAIKVVGGILQTYIIPPLEFLASGVMAVIRDAISDIADYINSPEFQQNLKDWGQSWEDIKTACEPIAQLFNDIGTAIDNLFLKFDPERTSSLDGFVRNLKLGVEALKALHEATSGDWQGAYDSMQKMWDMEIENARIANMTPEEIAKAREEEAKQTDALAKATRTYNQTVQQGNPHIKTFNEFLADYNKGATQTVKPVGQLATATGDFGFVSQKWLTATGLQAQNINQTGANATAAHPQVGTLGTNTSILGTNADGANPGLGLLGTNINTAGVNASTANPYLYDTGSNTYTIGANSGAASGPTSGFAGSLDQVGSSGYNAAAGLDAARIAYINYVQAMGQQVVQGPITPQGEMPHLTTPYGSTPPGGNWGQPTGYEGMSDEQKAKYAADQQKALRDAEAAAKAREGPAGTPSAYSTVVSQYQEGGYWWTKFGDGHVVRGAAVSTAPTFGTKNKTPFGLPEEYAKAYQPTYNVTINNPIAETPSQSIAAVKRVNRTLGARMGAYA